MPTLRPPYVLDNIPGVLRGVYKIGGANQHEVPVIGALISEGFVSGTSGWRIDGDGDVEFNSGVFRGKLEAGEIHIPDETTTGSFHVDTDGDVWIGETTANRATAPVRIDSATGNITISGDFTVETGGEITAAGVTLRSGFTMLTTTTVDGIEFNLPTNSEGGIGFRNYNAGTNREDSFEVIVSSGAADPLGGEAYIRMRSFGDGGTPGPGNYETIEMVANEVAINGPGSVNYLVFGDPETTSEMFEMSTTTFQVHIADSPVLQVGTDGGGRLGITGDLIRFNSVSSNTDYIQMAGVGNVSIVENGTELLRLVNVSSACRIRPNGNGDTSSPMYSFLSDANTGIYRIGSGRIAFTGDGTKIGEIGTSGWFGEGLDAASPSTHPALYKHTSTHEIFYDSSTKRIKRNIVPFDPLSDVTVLPRIGRRFNPLVKGKRSDEVHYGAIAEELHAISPELVGLARFAGPRTARRTDDESQPLSPSHIAYNSMLIALWDRVAAIEERLADV